MDLKTKPHQESYERRSYMLQNTKEGRDKIEKDLVSLTCLEVKIQKAKND